MIASTATQEHLSNIQAHHVRHMLRDFVGKVCRSGHLSAQMCSPALGLVLAACCSTVVPGAPARF